jgi:hypothetical protein
MERKSEISHRDSVYERFTFRVDNVVILALMIIYKLIASVIRHEMLTLSMHSLLKASHEMLTLSMHSLLKASNLYREYYAILL